MAVAYVSRGAWTVSTGDCTPPIPAGYADGNLLVLFVETANQAVSAPSGWTEVTNSPQGTGTAGAAGGVRVSLFYKIVSGTPTAPTITDSGDHTNARIYLFSGNDTTTPFNTSAGRVQETASTTYTGNALTTTRDGCLIVDLIAMDRDAVSTTNLSSWANASLASITEFDDRTDSGATGGGVGAAYGIDTTAGSVNATTATITSMVYACITVAIQPPSTAENKTGALSITQASTVAALGTIGAKGAVSVSQASTVSALGKKAVSGAVSVAQASSTTIAGTRSEGSENKTGSVSVSQASEVAILGKVGLNGAVSVSQGSSVAVSGKPGAKGTVSVAQGSSVSALGTMGAKGSVSVADASSVAISGTKFVQTYEFFGRLDVAQTSNASVSGNKSVGGAVNIYQVSAVQTFGKKNSSGSFSLAQASSVSIFGFRTIVKAFSLSSTVNLVRTRNGSLNGTKKHTSVYRNSKSLSSVLNDTYRKETKI